MAKVLSKTGVQTGQTIQAFHISQSVDAFTGLSAYNITISGGLTVNGYSFPSQDGAAQQTLATDGSGNLTFQTLPLAVSASYVTSSGVDGPLGFDSITTASYAVSASHVEFADLASASYHAVNASDANTATSASYARTASVVTDSNVALLDQSNTFTGQTQTFTDIVVNGTGSFAYFESVTGSAKIIGDAYIILNNNTPAERYAGLVIQDSGSAGVTASLEFDGQTNDWFYEYSDDGGLTTDHGVVLFGPEYNTKGSPTYPTSNRLVKGNGDHHIVDSSITDNGTTVSTTIPFTATQITASTGFQGNLVGDVTGTSTTASYVEGSNVDGTVSSATSASYAVSASHVEFADDSRTAISSSYATSGSHAEFADNSRNAVSATSATSASHAITASYALNAQSATTDTGSLLTTASAAGTTITFTKGDGSTFDLEISQTGSVQSASFATSASHAEFSDNSRDAISSSFAVTASYAVSSSHEIIQEVSSSYADTASFALTASYALNAGSTVLNGITGAYTASFTDIVSSSFTHNLNTRNIVAAVYDASYNEIIPETVTLSNLNTIFIDFGVTSSGYLVVSKVGGPSGNTYKETISGNTSYTVTHNLAEDYPLVQVYESGSKRQVVPEDIISLNSSSVQIDFNFNFNGNVIIKK